MQPIIIPLPSVGLLILVFRSRQIPNLPPTENEKNEPSAIRDPLPLALYAAADSQKQPTSSRSFASLE